MTCEELNGVLDPFVDGELDPAAARSVATHLAECRRCAERVADTRTMNDALRSELPALAAPDDLRTRIEREIRASLEGAPSVATIESPGFPPRVAGPGRSAKRATPPRTWDAWRVQWLAAAVLLMVVGGGSWQLGFIRGRAEISAGGVLATRDAVVASHLRSLEANHLVDVPSSDRHIVKPWFSGKLDFSPTVPDLATQGFPLIGGRLDYLDGHAAAALVYGRARHVINVFVWPTTGPPAATGTPPAVRGFRLRHWVRDGMQYWAVSDVADADLDALVSLLRAADSTPASEH